MKKLSLLLLLFAISTSQAATTAEAGGMSGGGFNVAQESLTIQTTDQELMVFAETDVDTDSLTHIGSYMNNNNQIVEIFQDPKTKDLILVYGKIDQ